MLVLMIAIPVDAQDYPVVTVDFRELQLVPEDTTPLKNSVAAFRTEDSLISLLESNNTVFWEHLGAFDASFEPDSSIDSYAIVQMNESGFYETIVALDATTGDLVWARLVDTNLSANFTLAVTTATDYFSNDGHYWGLSEEIVLVPGANVGLDVVAAWVFKFYLVGETERWTLFVNTDGGIETFEFTDIPCQSCNNNTILVIAGLSGAIVLLVSFGLYMKRR